MISLSKELSKMQYIEETLTAVYEGFINRRKTRYASILLESRGVYTSKEIEILDENKARYGC
jgi:hypothetical protein